MKHFFGLIVIVFFFTGMLALADESFTEIKLDKSKIYAPVRHRIVSDDEEEAKLLKVEEAKQQIQYQGEDYMYRQNQQMMPANPMFMNPLGGLGTIKY